MDREISNAYLYRIALNTWKDKQKKHNLQVVPLDESHLNHSKTDMQLFTRREPDDQLAIVKIGPFYKIRFGYLDVQKFGFFLFRHERSTALHSKDNAGQVQECLVLQANDTAALYEQLTRKGHIIMETESKTDSV